MLLFLVSGFLESKCDAAAERIYGVRVEQAVREPDTILLDKLPHAAMAVLAVAHGADACVGFAQEYEMGARRPSRRGSHGVYSCKVSTDRLSRKPHPFIFSPARLALSRSLDLGLLLETLSAYLLLPGYPRFEQRWGSHVRRSLAITLRTSFDGGASSPAMQRLSLWRTCRSGPTVRIKVLHANESSSQSASPDSQRKRAGAAEEAVHEAR